MVASVATAVFAVLTSLPSGKGNRNARIRSLGGGDYKIVIPNHKKKQDVSVSSKADSIFSIDHSSLTSRWSDLKDIAGSDGVLGSINYAVSGESLGHAFRFESVKRKGKKLVLKGSLVTSTDDFLDSSYSSNSLEGALDSVSPVDVSRGVVSGLGFSLGMPSGSESIVSDLADSASSLLKSFDYRKVFAIPGSDSSVTLALTGTPSFTPKLNTPSLLSIADFDQYSFSAEAGLDWSGTLTLDTPSEIGKYSFSKSIELEPIHQDFNDAGDGVDVSTAFSPKVDLDLDFSLTSDSQLGKSLVFSVGQDLKVSASVSTKGIEFENLSKPFQSSLRSGGARVDDITGFVMSGALTADVEATAVVSADVPIFGKQKVATVTADFNLPVSLTADETPSIVALLNGDLDVDVTPVLGSTISKDFPIGPYKSDNLLNLLA